ncbi:MAG: hypothetical protein B5M46_02850 [Epsilonproteobacteria bacterium 4484_20]|nr:MAG: hypothetical protein B5M46_02850 [Epsilonproteobacteria bacterium 4484_20]
MWNWNDNLSPEMNINKNLVEHFKKYAKISGTLFIVLGMAGIFFPTFMSFTTLVFISYLMLFAGISAGWLTWISNRSDWAGWLKSFLLVMVGLFMILYPMQGIAALGLLLAIYFFTDAFAGFGLAFSLRPKKIWLLWFVNAVTSLILGVIFLAGWPFSALYMVGILVGISLLLDGIILFSGGVFLENIDKDEK